MPASFRWHAGPPTWGPALVCLIGCTLPLLLGLFTGHSGFLWAATGAFLAAQANPLQRFGMLRMLLLISFGALSVGLGFWAASQASLSLALFALYGLLLAWMQRFGSEIAKLGVGLAMCLALGQGQFGHGDLHNPYAVATLFTLGGLWSMLLAFILRGVHGLRMWPLMPRLPGLLRTLRRRARRLPRREWRLYAVGCVLALGVAGLVIQGSGIPRGYWLSLALICTLQIEFQHNLKRTLQTSAIALALAALLITLGHSLQSPPQMVMALLPLLFLSRAFQAHGYPLYVVQTALCFVLLAESLSHDWHLPQARLLNTLLGVLIAVVVAVLIHFLRRRLLKA